MVAFAAVLACAAAGFGLAVGLLPRALRPLASAPAATWGVYFLGLRAGWWGNGTGDGWWAALVAGTVVLSLCPAAGMLAAHVLGSRTRSKPVA